jgi:hypothetical protein
MGRAATKPPSFWVDRVPTIRGEHVGRELEAVEASPRRPGKGLQGAALEAGDALQQDASPPATRAMRESSEMSLADDRVADLGAEGLDPPRRALDRFVDLLMFWCMPILTVAAKVPAVKCEALAARDRS